MIQATSVELARHAWDFRDAALFAERVLGERHEYQLNASLPIACLFGTCVDLALRSYILAIEGLLHEATDSDECPPWGNVVRTTRRYRPNSLSLESIAISHDGAECAYFLECGNSDPQYEGPVIEWGPAHDGGKHFASNFLDFNEIMRRRHWKLTSLE